MKNIEYTLITYGFVSRFCDVPDDAVVRAIDGVDVIGRCESCKNYILDGDLHMFDSDGCFLCERCTLKIAEKDGFKPPRMWK